MVMGNRHTVCHIICFKYECSRGHLFVLSWARVRWLARGSVVSE